MEETELLAFDCFWQGAHYHYGPRNKNHRIYWDTTLVEDPLEWVFDQLENRRLGAMIERAGYPGIAADLDLDKVAAVLPALKQKAREMQAEGEAPDRPPRVAIGADPELWFPPDVAQNCAGADVFGRSLCMDTDRIACP